MEGLWRAEVSVVAWVQDAPGWLAAVLRVLTELGVVGLYLTASAVLYWCVAPRLGVRLALLILAGTALNAALKLVSHGPRPYWLSAEVVPYGTEPSFGLPSGHATASATAWGLVVVRTPSPRKRMATLAVLVILVVGLSRVYLGVHFPSDVLGGWLLALVLLAALIRYERPVLAWWRTCPPAAQLLVALAVSAVPLVIGGVADLAWDWWTWPADWTGTPQPGDLDSLVPVAGAGGGLLGMLAGLTWLGRRGGYRATGSVRVRVGRLAVGAAGAVLIWLVTGLVPGADSSAGQYVRYALEAFWVTAGAPHAFLVLGLRERESDGQ